MPFVEFKGKSLVRNHHLTVPHRELVPRPKLSLTGGGNVSLNDNLLVHGDNLAALKSLLPTYGGRVNCVYIDPPYNTGNEGWIYSDRVASPMISEWLGKTVDSDDLTRHDKWLCMMYPRLQLLREMLAEDGVIFVSINDIERDRLRMIMDEIFGENNFLSSFIWKSRQIVDSRPKNGISVDHEYIIAYGNGGDAGFVGKESDRAKYTNPDNDPRGAWMSNSILGLATKQQRPNLHYVLVNPATGAKYPCPPETGWRYAKDVLMKKVEEGRIVFPRNKNGNGRPREKKFLSELTSQYTGFSSVLSNQAGYTLNGTREVRAILGENVFDFPKPSSLIKMLIKQIANKDAIILDSFAGSGTTAQAVLELNKEDGGNRQFILVECEKYADKITAERVRRVIRGYQYQGIQQQELYREKITWGNLSKNADNILATVENVAGLHHAAYDEIDKQIDDGMLKVIGKRKIKERVPGLGSTFSFWKLGEPIKTINILKVKALPSWEEMARFVFFTATGEQWNPAKANAAKNYLGDSKNYAVHLFYSPDFAYLKKSVFTLKEAEKLRPSKKPRLVFAPTKAIARQNLNLMRIEFAQLPFEIYKLEK